MQVKRIVADIYAADIAAAKRFYHDVLGLELLMDLGFIATYGTREPMPVQISFLSEGGSGTPAPDLSIEVDDVNAAFDRMREGDSPSSTGRLTSLGVCGDSMFAILLANS